MTMDKSRLSTCVYLCFAAVLITASQGQPTRPEQQQQQGVTSNYSTTSNTVARPQIKKDVFMSRGWGAAGMPFNMVYLNHFTKAHKAYAHNLQLQQQQQEQQRQREAEQIRLRSGGTARDQAGLDQPRTLPYGSRYASAASEPQTNAQQSEVGNNGNHREDEYGDSGVYLAAKPSSPRRQYNVPQLFVSYGWGPMG
uniref:Putative conserved secreted protein n=1 Tax=Culex tarsalis TaxID=7177 RepID=A0A1Q3F558_CULTA